MAAKKQNKFISKRKLLICVNELKNITIIVHFPIHKGATAILLPEWGVLRVSGKDILSYSFHSSTLENIVPPSGYQFS